MPILRLWWVAGNLMRKLSVLCGGSGTGTRISIPHQSRGALTVRDTGLGLAEGPLGVWVGNKAGADCGFVVDITASLDKYRVR